MFPLALLWFVAPAWATKPAWLSCDPDTMKFKPTISIGEDEIAPPIFAGAKKDGETQTYFLSNESPNLDHRVQEAGEGKYFLGMQSLYLNEAGQKKRKLKLEHWSKARIFGLDHALPGALAALLRAFSEVKASPVDRPAKVKPDPSESESLLKPNPKLLQAKQLFLRSLADNPYLRESWKTARKIRGKIPNMREEAVAQLFDQVVEDASLDQEKLIGDLIKSHPWYDRLPFLDLIAGVERGYVAVLKKYGAGSRLQMPNTIPFMMEKFFRLEGDLADAGPLEKATAHWRVLFVASSVSALLCKASEESKNIVALAEADQIPDLRRLLKESFGTSIKILDAKSMDESEDDEEVPAAAPVKPGPSAKPSAKPKSSP